MATGIDVKNEVRSSFDRATQLLNSGDVLMAESICRESLHRYPEDCNLLCLLGLVLNRQQRPSEAETALRTVVEKFPEFAKAHEELGSALMANNQPEKALEHVQRAVEIEPDNGQAQFQLGRILAVLGRSGEAASAYNHSSRVSPYQYALARAAEHRDAGRLDEAEKIYRELLAADPDDANVFHLLGLLAMHQEQFGDAIVLLRRAVALSPDRVAAWIDLGRALGKREAFNEAIDAVQNAIKLEWQTTFPYLVLGGLYVQTGRYEDALNAYRSGLEIQPGHAACRVSLGHVLKTIGRHDDAVRAYRELIRMHPEFGGGYWGLANLKNVRFEPAEIQAMLEHASNESLSDEVRVQFNFALGKAFEDEGEYGRAFQFFQMGNTVRRAREIYDAVDTQTTCDQIIEVFDRNLLHVNASRGCQDPSPIFIVGLPRSGSTLIEQILASHSEIEGTRELPELGRIIRAIERRRPGGESYPQSVHHCSTEMLADFGRQYIESTQRYRTGKPRFIDKMPNNFRSVGLLHLILPNARIIDARRHPLDSCLGTYKQLFSRGQPFSYDLFELGEYYLQYRRLMDHWHKVLPGKVLDVHYEELIHDPARQMKRLLKYIGVAWEEDCLNFHETARAVDSASSEQVRQPIYNTSINSWRHYEKDLGELIAILQPLLSRLPEDQKPASRSM